MYLKYFMRPCRQIMNDNHTIFCFSARQKRMLILLYLLQFKYAKKPSGAVISSFLYSNDLPIALRGNSRISEILPREIMDIYGKSAGKPNLTLQRIILLWK